MNDNSNDNDSTINQSMPSFYPLEINGTKYLICKLPDQPFSTLHDPETKQIVGQWNNDAAQYEIFPLETSPPAPNPSMTPEQFKEHMRQLIASGAAFTSCP
jgi:hypothetical protein